MGKLDVTVRLSCGHELRFSMHPPRMRETCWCQSCQRYREVTKAPGKPKEYSGKCRHCRKGYRAVCLTDVYVGVVKHVNTRGHSVEIFDNDGETLLTMIDSSNVTGFQQETLGILVDTQCETG
jgi:hypothetical protein